jgi:DNA-binding response OmpR family regulator
MADHPGSPSGVRLLLVDDYPDGLELLALLLEQSGYTVDAAQSGAEAIGMALRNPPDLAILDMQLPDITGLDVARELRRRAETASVPMIALTGRGSARDAEDAREAGITEVLVKPCDPPHLLATIKSLLGARASTQEHRAKAD